MALDGTDFSAFSIEEALAYQKQRNLSLEEFITLFANKLKFKVSFCFSKRNQINFVDY
jgi:hypothetical protein